MAKDFILVIILESKFIISFVNLFRHFKIIILIITDKCNYKNKQLIIIAIRFIIHAIYYGQTKQN